MSVALTRIAARVRRYCRKDSTVQALQYGALLTPAALAARLQEACRGDAQAIASRAFGGPHGALLAGAADDARACMSALNREGGRLLASAFKLHSECVRRTHRGKACDARLADKLAVAEGTAVAKLALACSALKDLIGIDVSTFTGRVLEQERCLLAATHGDTAPFALDCGPRPAIPVPPRGQWVQVVLPSAEWGTRCGNGSNYAFWMRLAAADAAPERVMIHLQGGGVCVFESDCKQVNSGLFEALSDYRPNGPSGGIFSTDPSVNPFAGWTMLALPYCTQDIFLGGGVSSVFPSITVERYGAINMRAALRYLRDVLWSELNASSPEGFRPDRLTVLLTGTSAGGFGATYNHHYLLDDLRWIHTTAAPDSAMGMDTNSVFGLRTLGQMIAPESGWNTRPFQPPYCLASDCLVVPKTQAAASARLKAVPEQQILNLSNQVDSTQTTTTMFQTDWDWTNALRAVYCTNQGLPGVRYFLPASSTSIHGIVTSTTRFTSLSSAGVTVRDWLAGAFSAPDSVVDRVVAGNLNADPFTCPVQ